MTKAHDNALVPKTCVVMSEVADITDALLKSTAAAPLLAALNDSKTMGYFKSLSVRLITYESLPTLTTIFLGYRSPFVPPLWTDTP